MIVRTFFLVLLLVPFAAQAAAVNAAANAAYYSIRPDLRKCVSPLCGGVFVQRVNQVSTRCADGSRQRECYAAAVDLSALGLREEQAAAVQSRIRSGTVLLKGRLENQEFPDFGRLGRFVAAEVWAAATDAAPSGNFFRLNDKGLVCITDPCLSFREAKLNSRRRRDLAGVDLIPVGAGDADLSAALAQKRQAAGILAAGAHRRVSGPAGRALAFVASQFYLPVNGTGSRLRQNCQVGGCSGELCSDRSDLVSACIYRPEFACYQTAICERQPGGNCSWTPSAALNACLEAAGSQDRRMR